MTLEPLIRGAVLIAALMLAASAAAEPVITRAAPHQDYARIVLEWEAPVAFEARIEDDILRVNFPRTLETDLSPALERLPDYLDSAELSGDRRTVYFHLARPLELSTSIYGNRVVLDLASISPAGGGGRAAVAVRRGEHPGFSRLVFDWPRFVDYRVDREDSKATVTFSHPGPIDLSALTAAPLRLVRWAKSASERKRAIVTIGLPPAVHLRIFRWGTKVVIDVLGDAGADPAPAPAPAPAAPSRREAAVAATPPAASASGSESVPEAVPAPTVVTEPPVAAAGPSEGVPPEAAAAAPSPAAAGAEEPRREQAVGAPRNLLASRADQERSDEAAAGIEKADRALAPAQPASAAEAAAPEGPPAGPPEKARAAGQDRDAASGLAVDMVPTFSGPRLRFTWPEPVAAAVFQRGRHLWVVFEKYARADLSATMAEPGGPVVSAGQLPYGQATVLRFELEPGLLPRVLQRDTSWLVDLVDHAVAAETTIEVRPEPQAALGPRLFLPAIDLGEAIELRDPEAGDRLVVVPFGAPVRAMPVERDFLEVKVLATAHGVAVAPAADGIGVRALRNGVTVGKAGGLMLSSAADRNPVASPALAARRLFHFERWRGGPPQRFLALKQQLFREIAAARPDDRNDHRLKLAQFYFAHGFAADARGILETIEENDPRVLTDLPSRALRGAVDFLLQRFDTAAQHLYHADFDGHPEIAVWRAALAARTKDWHRAKREFAIGLRASQAYPRDLRIRFLLLEARTALATNEVEHLDAALIALADMEPPEGVLSEVAYMQGRAHERLGRYDTALESYQKAIASDHRAVRARAELARVNLLLKRDDLSRQRAIDRLEGLRFVWRGDDFELSVLQQLGELYVAEGDYREALDSLRKAVTHFPKDDATRAAAQSMNEIFANLFLEGGADAMTPVSALAVYYEFRELTPIGAKGDEMIRRLADRLVAVDLLGRAAELLGHQVRSRLEGAEKARVGARLAVIQLLDNRPSEALATLSESAATSLATALVAERRRLEARALADLERYDEALSLLSDETSPEGRALRGEIHWRAGDWVNAAQTFEALLGERWQRQEPLEAVERQQLMQLAVSFALAADQAGLDRVRLRYSERLGEGADADAFRVVTSTVDRRGTEFRQLAGRIAEVSTLQAFMASYRKKLSNGGLSAIN